MREVKQVISEMFCGLAVWLAVVLVVLLVVAQNKLAAVLGVLAGGLAAVILIGHMYRHLDIALDMDSGQAQRHTQFAAMQRLAIMAVVLVISMTQYQYIHPVGTVLGIFGVKISALMQPLMHKLLQKKGHRAGQKKRLAKE